MSQWAKSPADVRRGGVQIAIHRLLFDLARGIPDNSDLALNALTEAGAKIGERDLVRSEDGEFLSAHPLQTRRIIEGDNHEIGAVSALKLLGRPHWIAQVSEGRFTGEGYQTGEVIESAADKIRRAINNNDGYNEIIDARNKDGARIIPYAWDNLNNELPSLLFETYPYIYPTYADWSNNIKRIKELPSGWQASFNMCFCVCAETLLMTASLKAAQAGTNSDTSVATLETMLDELYAPWINKNWKVFAANLGISIAGDWLNEDEQGATHPNGYNFKEPSVILTIRAIRAINNFNDRLPSKHPNIMRIAMARTADYYDNDGKPFFYSMIEGTPAPWPEEGTEKRFLVEAIADLHYPIAHTDIVMTDMPIECLEILAGKA